MSTLPSRIGDSAGRHNRRVRSCCEQLEPRQLMAVVTTGDLFGASGTGNLILQQTDTDGDIVRYSLTGGGTGQVVDSTLQLTGTTERSVLKVTVRRSGGDGLVTLTGITADGSMKSIDAKPAIVAGNIVLNSAAEPGTVVPGVVAVNLSQVVGGSILTGGEPISSLTVQNWSESIDVTQEVRAPWIGTLSVRGRADDRRIDGDQSLPGDFGASVILDSSTKGLSLKKATIAGMVQNIEAIGNIGSLTAGSIDGSIIANLIGTVTARIGRGAVPDGSATGLIDATGAPAKANQLAIGTVRIAGDASGLAIRTEAGNLGNVTITGNTDSTQILSAGSAKALRVDGTFSNSRIQAQGNVTSVTLGAMTDSNVLVGFAPDFAGDAPVTNADFANGADTAARLGTFTAGRTRRGAASGPQITGTDNLSAAQLGNVRIFDLESTDPPSLHVFVLADATGQSPASVRYTDTADSANSFNWKRGQTQPLLLQDMLTVL